MNKYKDTGWKSFLKGYPWFDGENKFKIEAYSEFMPPIRTGVNPSDGTVYPWSFDDDDLFGWKIHEIEEEYQLRPGLVNIGRQVLEHTNKMGEGTLPVSLVGHHNSAFANNIYWSDELAGCLGKLKREKYITIVPFSLSKTKDDKGRVCWTFFGASEQGPEKAFWKSFYVSPEKEHPESLFINFLKWVFKQAFGAHTDSREDLISKGFRILPTGDVFPFSYWKTEKHPSWTKHYLVDDDAEADNIKYLLTFRPFDRLPGWAKERYAAGKLYLIPFPGSLLMWGFREYIKLQEQLHNAIHLPMLRLVKRDEGFNGLRVPQSGWFFQPGIKGQKAKMLEEFIVNNYIRTSRWDKFHRNEDGLIMSKKIDSVIETLFSTSLKALDLYNKPMARNSQLFSEEFELLIDGPTAGRKKIGEAILKLMEGGNFRYRFYFPPMRAGLHEVFWHRPLVACISKSGEPEIATDLLTGYMTGYHAGNPDPADAVELWPRFLRRDLHLDVLESFDPAHDRYLHQTSWNLLALLDTYDLTGEKPLDRDFARSLVRIPKENRLEDWLAGFPERAKDPQKGKKIARSVESILQPENSKQRLPEPLTFSETASREYEVAYWNQIHFLAHGEFINKDNADIILDRPTGERAGHMHRDLHKLGDYFLKRYRELIRNAGMEGKAECGELPFRWETDFEFPMYGGWLANQEGKEYERNLLVIIPGKNRKEAVVMGDHYDTAYMADVFYPESGGSGARLAAAGADDNHSASAALLLAAPIYLKMAKEGKLERDIWLIHLTGEEFPSDCLGARNFCQHIIQKTLKMHRNDGSFKDLSEVEVKGVLVMDMIAHNRDNDLDIFQIAPGKTGASLDLARQARLACQVWNANTLQWNESPDRKDCKKGERTLDARIMPAKAKHLAVDGEIRSWEDPHSTLYNTDGIIFSDNGIPVILFMENYDIHRKGYHDTHDTMDNIDLDYGAAVSAIAIETVAQLAALKKLD
ncbi:MAG: M28 family peptidase [Bacteroidetes bacterium]|nr:M28 family peptidase [Bacteroidota bacterium]